MDAVTVTVTDSGAGTVSAWLQTTSTAPMRVFAKDRLGTPGNFILRYDGAWHRQ